MKKIYTNYGKWIRLIAFLIVFVLINSFFSAALIPSALSRVIIHEMDQPDQYETVIFGQSHTSYGVDPEILEEKTGQTTMNASIGGEYMVDMYYMALEMYRHNTPKTVVIDMDYQYFINIPKKENTIMSTLVYNNYPFSRYKFGYAWNTLLVKEYRAALFPWLNYRDNYGNVYGTLNNKMTSEYKEYLPEGITEIADCDSYKGKGFIYTDRMLYKRDESQAGLGIWWNELKVDYSESIEYFKKIVDLCRENGSQVIMITSPINVETMFNGESVSEYNEIEQYFADIAKENNLTYYNFNIVKPQAYIRRTTDYWDYDGHMYGDSAEVYSEFLGEFLNKVIHNQSIDWEYYFYNDVFDMKENYEKDIQLLESGY